VADLGTFAQLRARGITHVVVCEADYHNCEKRGGNATMKARAAWYKELFQRPPVWEKPAGSLAYLQPGLRVYELPAQGGPEIPSGKTTPSGGAKRRKITEVNVPLRDSR
jgi:hypothetical protein